MPNTSITLNCILSRTSSLYDRNCQAAQLGGNAVRSDTLSRLIIQSESNLQKSWISRFWYVMFTRHSSTSWWHQYVTLVRREFRVGLTGVFDADHYKIYYTADRSTVSRSVYFLIRRVDLSKPFARSACLSSCAT